MSDEREPMGLLAAVSAVVGVLLMGALAVWFWWPQVQDAVAFWGWPTW